MNIAKINQRYIDIEKQQKQITFLEEIIFFEIEDIFMLTGCEKINKNTWIHRELDLHIHIGINQRSPREKI